MCTPQHVNPQTWGFWWLSPCLLFVVLTLTLVEVLMDAVLIRVRFRLDVLIRVGVVFFVVLIRVGVVLIRVLIRVDVVLIRGDVLIDEVLMDVL